VGYTHTHTHTHTHTYYILYCHIYMVSIVQPDLCLKFETNNLYG